MGNQQTALAALPPTTSPSSSSSRASIIGRTDARWLPDDSTSVCMQCSAPFTLFNRRHQYERRHRALTSHSSLHHSPHF